MRISLVLALLLGLSACKGKVGGLARGEGIPSNYQGVWMQQDEAIELRKSGKVQSLCAEIKKDPNSKVLNIRLVDSAGNIFIYDPQTPVRLLPKFGVIGKTGAIVPSEQFKAQMGGQPLKVSVKGDVMTFTFGQGNGAIAMDYQRSSQAEALKYIAAQEECKK